MNHLLEIVTTKRPTSVRVLKRLLAPIYYRCRLFIRPLWRTWYIAVLLVLRRRSSFKFVEVGVFKGDNAVRVIEVAKRFTTSIQYVGFDLFEDNEAFFECMPKTGPSMTPCRLPARSFSQASTLWRRCTASLAQSSLKPISRWSKENSTRTVHRVSSVRRVNGIHAYRSAEKNGEWLTMSEAATTLGVTHHRIRRLIKDGILPAEQVVPGAPYQIRADDLQQERVAAAIERTGRPCRSMPANQLPMFPDT